VTRRLAAILAADVVGYARAVEADETRTLQVLDELRQTVILPLLAEHRGRLVKTMGDGFLAELGSVVDAVACAVAIQRRWAEAQASRAPERRLGLRIGVHLGDVVVEGLDLLGDGVNIAARLESLAEPGGVLISAAAHEQLRGKLDAPFSPAGTHRLKNIERPVAVFRWHPDGPAVRPGSRRRQPRAWLAAAVALLVVAGLAAGGARWWWQGHEDPARAGRPAIAVLPFDDLSGDDASRRLAAGITEDIITDLSRFNEFDVIARNSTAVYAGKPVDVRAVGRELGVGYVLEGSIQREGDQLRVIAQLVDAASAGHLWSQRWDRPAQDLFAVQTEIAEEVAGRLGGFGVIERAEQRKTRQARPGDLTAYELYRQAQATAEGHTLKDVQAAIGLYKQAIALDPTWASAWVALAATTDQSTSFGADWEPAMRAAREAAEQAVRLDPQHAEAHAQLGHILAQVDTLARAEAEFDTALRLNPGSAVILTWYSGWASTFGHPERGAEAADRARRLDPHYPIWAINFYRWAYFMAGRFADALAVGGQQPADKRTRTGRVLDAAALAEVGRIDAAREAAARILADEPGFTIQTFVSEPGSSEAEREAIARAMRKAGFPACASAEVLATLQNPFPLPECAAATKG
jgi:TolB-like protein/class 3 adenylate cyclase